MTMGSKNNARRIHTEHRVYWNSQQNAVLPVSLRRLKGFFTRYARKHLRDFPWRQSGRDPFHLLLAELLLVQTKAEDVARLWPQLIRRYRTPARIAAASPNALVQLLRPLGLQRQRGRALTRVARVLVDNYASKIPRTVECLLSLPHVGLYVATAVACFAFHRRVPIVDANVVRVLDRITGVHGVHELRRRLDVWKLAWALLPRKAAALHNYGLLDFAAMTCTSRAPRCSTCNLVSICAYGQRQLSSASGKAG